MITRTMLGIPISIKSSGRPSVVVRASLARIEGGGKVSFTDCHIHCLDPRNTARTLIHAKSGRLQVRGCDFIDGALPREHLLLEESVLSANISDNTSRTPFTVTNKAKGKTVVRGNLSEG